MNDEPMNNAVRDRLRLVSNSHKIATVAALAQIGVGMALVHYAGTNIWLWLLAGLLCGGALFFAEWRGQLSARRVMLQAALEEARHA